MSRTYIRDWRGRFARTGSVRVRKVHRPTVRKPKLRRPSFEPGIIQIGRTKDPLTWDQIKGTNAKRDGRILWRLKKDGDIQTEDEFVKKADQLHRLYRKAHPNDKNFATKNSICNAALRQEFDETGKVKPLPVPGHTEKAGPSTPAPKKEVGKTPGGMKLLEKYKPDPKKKYHIFGKNHPLDSDLDYKKAQDEGDKAEIAFLKGKVKYYRAQQRDKRSAHTAPYGAYIKDVEERIDELENPELHTDKEFLEGLYGKDDPKEQAAREKARQERIAKREAKRLGEITYKNQPAFEIRTRVRQLTKELGDSMDGFFKYAQKLEAKDPNFDMSPDYIKRRHDIRQRNDQIMGDLGRLEQKLNTMEPDTSESIKDAKDIADLIRIMQNRHPSVDVSTDFVTSIPAAKAEFMSKYKYDVTRVERIMHNDDSILAAMKGSFAGIEQQMDRYPKLKIDAITDQVGATNQIEKTRVGASCSRGFTIKLNVNPFAVANPKRVHDNTANNDQTHWHPYGTEANVYQFNTIHEFGHAVDWRAFVWEQDKKDGYLDIDKNNQKRHAAIMKVLYKEYSDANDGNKPSGENELLVWIKAKKQVSAYSWERNDKGELTGQLQDDELLAEAWGACEFGAGRPTKVELALHNLMWEGLKKHGLT